jgi:hypothetical protein
MENEIMFRLRLGRFVTLCAPRLSVVTLSDPGNCGVTRIMGFYLLSNLDLR